MPLTTDAVPAPRWTFAELVGLSLLEPLRDKIAYFWSLVQPVLGIAFMAMSSGAIRLTPYDLAKYALYVCFVNSLYTTGATLLWKRESGLLRGFVRAPAARSRLVQVHVASSAVYGLVFTAVILLLLGLANRTAVTLGVYLGLLPVGVLASLLASAGSIVLMRTGMSLGNASAVLNIFAFLLAVLTFFVSPTTTLALWLQVLNPVTLFAAALYFPLEAGRAATVWIASAAWVACLLAAGTAGYRGLRSRPSNLR